MTLTKEQLKSFSRQTRDDLLDATTITYMGTTTSVGSNVFPVLSALAQKARTEDPSVIRGYCSQLNQNTFVFTNAQIVEFADLVLNKYQAIIDADISVCALIGNETITDTADIPDAFEAAIDSPLVRDGLGNLYTEMASKQDRSDTLDYLATIEEISEDMITLLGQSNIASIKSTMAFGISDISGLQTSLDTKATSSDITTAINALINSAPGTLNTLGEIAAALAADEGVTASLTTTVSGKVDKITGKGLSANDFTDTLKTKLDGISSGATANSSDATLLARANHTGTQVSSTISDFTEAAQDAVGGALSSDFSYNDAGNSIGLRAKSFANNQSTKTIQTVAASANGFQVSSTRDAFVSYSVSVTTVVQIGVGTNVSGYIALEVAATNSSTAGDWVEISRSGSGQNIGLALALSSTQVTSGSVSGTVPAGYYARLRSVNSNGTPTYAYLSGQEVLF